MRCREIEPRAPARRRPPGARYILWCVLMLVAPAMAAAQCRPVPPERPAAAARADFDHGLLWKIETPNTRPSYLFGTIHSADPRVTTLPCPVQQAFDGAGSYTMETILNGASITSMAAAMFFSDDRTLRQVLGDPLYRRLLDTLGVDDSLGAAGLEHMKPWAVMMTLIGPRQEGGLFLDMALQARAIRQGKANHELESAAEQIAVFDGMSLDDQVALLRDAIEDAHHAEQALDELTEAYLRRDLAALQAIEDKYKPADARVYGEMTERLVTQRNHKMAERMRPYLKEGNAFVAVGALHLVGDSGLLRLLSDDGYQLTRVY